MAVIASTVLWYQRPHRLLQDKDPTGGHDNKCQAWVGLESKLAKGLATFIIFSHASNYKKLETVLAGTLPQTQSKPVF